MIWSERHLTGEFWDVTGNLIIAINLPIKGIIQLFQHIISANEVQTKSRNLESRSKIFREVSFVISWLSYLVTNLSLQYLHVIYIFHVV